MKEREPRSVPRAWLLDADGVIADPNTHKANPEVLKEIATLLSRGEPVAIITGRSLSWVREEILTPLPDSSDKNFFDGLFISAEFGGVQLEYKTGMENTQIQRDLLTPPIVRKDASMEMREFEHSMFEEEKEVVVSFAAKPGYPIDKFHEDQEIFSENLKKLLSGHRIENEFVVHVDTIGTNIRHKTLTKRFAVDKVSKWLESRKTKSERYMVIGDSQSDTEMAEELYSKGMDFTFAFVNDEHELDETKLNYPVVFTNKHFTEGTLEFIKSQHTT